MFEWSLTLSEKKSLTDDCLLTVDVEYLNISFVAYIIQFSPTFRNFGLDILSAYTANVLSAEIADECLQTKSTDNLQ